MTHPSSLTPATARPSVAEIQQQLGRELSLRDRVIYLLLLLFDLAVGTVVASLWLTEPSLPPRTHVAFGLIVLGSLVWAGFFTWTLARRKVLLARHRLIAGRIAMTFTALFTLGCLVIATRDPELRAPGLAAAGFGAVLCAVAALVLTRARRRYRELLTRRDQLERQLGSAPWGA